MILEANELAELQGLGVEIWPTHPKSKAVEKQQLPSLMEWSYWSACQPGQLGTFTKGRPGPGSYGVIRVEKIDGMRLTATPSGRSRRLYLACRWMDGKRCYEVLSVHRGDKSAKAACQRDWKRQITQAN